MGNEELKVNKCKYSLAISNVVEDTLMFARWINIEGIRANQDSWAYRGDNYSERYSTKEMYSIYSKIDKKTIYEKY